MKLDSNRQALENLKIIHEKFGYDILGDDALFTMAKLYEEKLNDKEEAMKLYQELLEKYPGSIFISESRKRFRTLRGDPINWKIRRWMKNGTDFTKSVPFSF